MSKKKVLILDDEIEFVKTMHDFLKMQGYDVKTATTMDEALSEFGKHKPKAVLLDYSMPVINGDQFLPLLQEIEPLVKVIVISGCAPEEVQGKFSGMGYYAYFQKGHFSLVDIKKSIDEIYSY